MSHVKTHIVSLSVYEKMEEQRAREIYTDCTSVKRQNLTAKLEPFLLYHAVWLILQIPLQIYECQTHLRNYK